jgi:ubiquinone/menaquinone biosynthesis C-methylase UbiE
MSSSVLVDTTTPYAFLESFFYDRVIAPGVTSMMAAMSSEWQSNMASAKQICDVGCGGGQIMAMLASQFTEAHFVGVDLSPDQVRRAEQRLAPFASRSSLKEGSALALPLPDNQFDVVYSIASIKHWSDQQQGLLECVRVLKPGGRLVIVEVDRACTLADTEAFISGWKIPNFLHIGAIALFRTWVAGHSLDILDAQALAARLPLKQCSVKRIDGTPAFVLQGIKKSER